ARRAQAQVVPGGGRVGAVPRGITGHRMGLTAAVGRRRGGGQRGSRAATGGGVPVVDPDEDGGGARATVGERGREVAGGAAQADRAGAGGGGTATRAGRVGVQRRNIGGGRSPGSPAAVLGAV